MSFDLYAIVLYPLIYIFPAYVANAVPVIFGGGVPLDFRKKFRGQRLFGDHKTVRGTLSGISGGTLIGLIYVQFPQFSYMLPIAFMLALGAMAGDVLGSFIKRRMKVEPGASTPIMDQYGFLVFALLFAFWMGHLPEIYGIIFLFMLTGILHLLSNKVAHRLKLKKVPW